MIILLMVLTLLLVVVAALLLLYFVFNISLDVESAGGSPDSYVAKIDFGVKAIARETGYLGPQVTQLNQGLSTLADKLGVVDGHLAAAATALGPKEGGR